MAGATTATLTARALRWLAQRDHSRAGLRRKLERAAAAGGPAGEAAGPEAAAEIERVLDELAAAGLLDDARAAEALVSAKSRRFGPRKLRAVLHDRGLTGDAAEAALAAAGDELARAREVWRRRFGAPPADAREAARQARFLAGRGFGGEVIRRLLRTPDEDAGA